MILVDIDKKLSTFNRRIRKGGTQFQTADFAAEKVNGAMEQVDQKRSFLLEAQKNDGGILIDAQHRIVAEHNGDAAVPAGQYPVSGVKHITHTDRGPFRAAGSPCRCPPLNGSYFTYPGLGRRLRMRNPLRHRHAD
jgi:hypothetical protein